ncbi:hypothetical protein CAL29_22975 [Bordetella genomosp. 10]|uniref:Uncharacterized protein n=1 Tax=Bordetella genomosp. 10 TaxID=1416804 RepID=A0A261S207_9BORD|nr:hypothetical protein CAL29_22975 [Bordetella genomosp. 10]
MKLDEHYLSIDLGTGLELVQVIGVKIHFWVETLDKQELIIDAVQTVDAILKDYDTGEIEFVHRTE